MSVSNSVVDSASMMKSKFANSPRKIDRQKLLYTLILNAVIVIKPFGGKTHDNLRTAAAGVTMFLPAATTLAGLSHASLWVPFSENQQEGILLEYGRYDEQREGDYKDQVHYLEGSSGLRFLKM